MFKVSTMYLYNYNDILIVTISDNLGIVLYCFPVLIFQYHKTVITITIKHSRYRCYYYYSFQLSLLL